VVKSLRSISLAFNNWWLWKILRIPYYTQHFTNVEVRQVTGCNRVSPIICSRRRPTCRSVVVDWRSATLEQTPPNWRCCIIDQQTLGSGQLRQISDPLTTDCTRPLGTQPEEMVLNHRWANIVYKGPHLKFHCYRGPHIYYVYFIYNLQRMKIWLNDNI